MSNPKHAKFSQFIHFYDFIQFRNGMVCEPDISNVNNECFVLRETRVPDRNHEEWLPFII